MTSFRRGMVEAEKASRSQSQPFEYGLLPDAEKERLCRTLLSEFGVTHVKVREPDGELIHCCPLPWHDEKNPSASLNYKRLTFRCLGCDSKGGLLWFIGTCRGESGQDARGWLNDQTGSGVDEQSLSALLDFFDAVYGRADAERTIIPKMSPKVLDPWMLIHPYLTEDRGIPEESVIRFKAGWNRASNRIVIPHWWRGDLVGWQSRRLENDGSPKYQSTPDFPKDQTLFNHRPGPRTVIVESPMSVISKSHLSMPVEATFGASVTDRQCLLAAEHKSVILFFDNDQAGWNATRTVAERLESYCPVWVADNPWAADPADLSDDAYQRCIDGAMPSCLWSPPRELLKLTDQ